MLVPFNPTGTHWTFFHASQNEQGQRAIVVFDSRRRGQHVDAHLHHVSVFMELLGEYSPNFSGPWPAPTFGDCCQQSVNDCAIFAIDGIRRTLTGHRVVTDAEPSTRARILRREYLWEISASLSVPAPGTDNAAQSRYVPTNGERMLALDAVEDGTLSIPCVAFCSKKFATHAQQKSHWRYQMYVVGDAAHHDGLSEFCPFQPITGCELKAFPRHNSAHGGDYRGLRCSQCFKTFGNMLKEHEHARDNQWHSRAIHTREYETAPIAICTAPPFSIGTPLRILVIGRSSGNPPVGYGETLRERLAAVQLDFGDVLRAYRDAFAAPEADAGAAFHYAAKCQTRYIPFDRDLGEVMSGRETTVYLFTQSITSDLEHCANPIIVSIGIDGFTCNVVRLLPWLRRVVRFQFVLAFQEWGNVPPELQGLPFFRNEVYWLEFSSTDLMHRLEVVVEQQQPPGDDAPRPRDPILAGTAALERQGSRHRTACIVPKAAAGR